MKHFRRAYLCTNKSCVPPYRVFLQPGDPDPPRCPEHGRTMQLQGNLPYAVDGKRRVTAARKAMAKAKR